MLELASSAPTRSPSGIDPESQLAALLVRLCTEYEHVPLRSVFRAVGAARTVLRAADRNPGDVDALAAQARLHLALCPVAEKKRAVAA